MMEEEIMIINIVVLEASRPEGGEPMVYVDVGSSG